MKALLDSHTMLHIKCTMLIVIVVQPTIHGKLSVNINKSSVSLESFISAVSKKMLTFKECDLLYNNNKWLRLQHARVQNQFSPCYS